MDNNTKQNIYLVCKESEGIPDIDAIKQDELRVLILMKQRTNSQNSSETPMCATTILQILPICRMKVKKAKITLSPTT